MTETETQQTMDPKQVLRALHKAHVGKEAAENATGTQIREALRQTKAYQDSFSKVKDEATALDEMRYQVVTGQEVPAWLLDGDFENSFGGKKKGHGAKFILPNGQARFVDFQGALPNAGPPLSEYVFPGATIMRSVVDGTEDYDFRGVKPIAKKHGKIAPAIDLTKTIAKCWKYVDKLGVVKGESYGQELAILTVTSDEDEIRFYPPGDYSDRSSLKFMATDGGGNVLTVEADPEEVAADIGLSIDSPPKMWKMKLKGKPVAAFGQVSVFMSRGDKFFGKENGFLADEAAKQGARMVPNGKDPSKVALQLKDIYNAETNPAPAIVIGDKAVYRLESYLDGEGKVRWNAYVRLDQEKDNVGKPLPPNMNCVVKRGKSGKSFNEGAWVKCLGFSDGHAKASESTRQLLMVE